MWILFTCENLRALRVKSSYAFLKRPPGLSLTSHVVMTCRKLAHYPRHYTDVIMSAKASQITGVATVCSTVCSGIDQRRHQSSAPLAFVRGIQRWPVAFVRGIHRWPVTGGFPSQRACNAENASIWWRYHTKRPRHRRSIFFVIRCGKFHQNDISVSVECVHNAWTLGQLCIVPKIWSKRARYTTNVCAQKRVVNASRRLIKAMSDCVPKFGRGKFPCPNSMNCPWPLCYIYTCRKD